MDYCVDGRNGAPMKRVLNQREPPVQARSRPHIVQLFTLEDKSGSKALLGLDATGEIWMAHTEQMVAITVGGLHWDQLPFHWK